MIQVGKMSYGLNKTLQMCTVKIQSGLGYKSSQVQVRVQVQVQVQQNGLKSGLESKFGLMNYKSDSHITVSRSRSSLSLWSFPTCRPLQLPTSSFIVIIVVT